MLEFAAWKLPVGSSLGTPYGLLRGPKLTACNLRTSSSASSSGLRSSPEFAARRAPISRWADRV